MLRIDLLELINRGNIWLFVGNGVSVDAGYPTWAGLVEGTLRTLEGNVREGILADERYIKAWQKKRYERCFTRIEAIAGRTVLEKAVATQLSSRAKLPGNILGHIIDWPIVGYVTTNYDGLLENKLVEVGELGWLPVGNSLDEIKKISGDATGVVWHIHGATNQPQDKNRLVLTEKDYDDMYLDGSPMVTQLRGLLNQRRILFVGFGFEDPEVMRLLKLVARFSTPLRPVFAFISGLSGTENESKRMELLEEYNIDVIPYRVINDSHDQLLRMLDFYSALILRRSLKFGQPERSCPSYDPETTGLMIYNQLALRKQGEIPENILDSLLKARIISLLKHRGCTTIEALASDLNERIGLAKGAIPGHLPDDGTWKLIKKCLVDLVKEGVVNVSEKLEEVSVVSLTAEGLNKVAGYAARSTRLSDQFSASLYDRTRKSFPENPEARSRVAKAAECFLKECIRRRALGVAMAWNSPRMDFQKYHIVGLLQALPEFLTQLSSFDEGLALFGVVQEVLASPSEIEKKYIGLALQAQFGVNLLGYAPETIETRARDLTQTLFLIDSSTLIPFVARSSTGYNSASRLLDRIKTVGSKVATTQMLALEVAEHARWAKDRIQKGPINTAATLIVTTGHAGSRSNSFLEGFFEEVTKGRYSEFDSYLDSVCSNPQGHTASDEVFSVAITTLGAPCFPFDEWEDFSQNLWEERDTLQEKIGERRKGSYPPTYKHPRQVRAEAEALIIIRNLRNGSFKFSGQKMSDAYFVSHTRVIDDVSGSGRPLTMRPEAVLQWLSTITACPPDELDCLFDNLLWELSERGLAILNRKKIEVVFSPLVHASRERLQEEIETHRILVGRRFGADPEKAFSEVSDLELPIVLESYYVQRSKELEKELEEERKSKELLRTQIPKGLSEKERRELKILRAKQKQKKKGALSKRRAAASRPKKKKK
jgi:hypothetical protein